MSQDQKNASRVVVTIIELTKVNIATYINKAASNPHQVGLLFIAISQLAVHQVAHRASHQVSHQGVLPVAVLRAQMAVAATVISQHQEVNHRIAAERRKVLRINLMMMAMMTSTWMAIMMMRDTKPTRITQMVLTMPWMNLMRTGKTRNTTGFVDYKISGDFAII